MADGRISRLSKYITFKLLVPRAGTPLLVSGKGRSTACWGRYSTTTVSWYGEHYTGKGASGAEPSVPEVGPRSGPALRLRHAGVEGHLEPEREVRISPLH